MQLCSTNLFFLIHFSDAIQLRKLAGLQLTEIAWNYYKLGFFLTDVSTSQNTSLKILVINI